MSTMENIKKAVEIFRKYDCPFELMHCISAYPFEDNKANLNLISVLKQTFKCDVGYSGHEKGGMAISCAAAALGITSLERHFTLDRTMYGSDQSASLTAKGFKELVESVRKIELALKEALQKQFLILKNRLKNLELILNKAMEKYLKRTINDSINLKKKLFKLSPQISKAIDLISSTLKKGIKFLFVKWRISSDAQHLAAEFLIRLRPKINRNPYPVISLAQDTSTITACGNDLGFENLFKRNFEALANKNDLLITLSTSGNSKNIIKVLKFAKTK